MTEDPRTPAGKGEEGGGAAHRIAAAVLGVALALAGGELFARAAARGRTELALYRASANPALGFEYRPGFVAPPELAAGGRAFDVNEHGFRGRLPDFEKEAGVLRVLVLGDSSTAGVGIADAERIYPNLLERALNAREGGGRHEVLNLGVGGYETAQEAELLRERGLAWDPDVVVVGFCVNDVSTSGDGGVRAALARAREGEGSLLARSHLLRAVRHAAGSVDRAAGGRREPDAGFLPVRAGFRALAELRAEHAFELVVALIPAFEDPFDAYRHRGLHRRVLALGERFGVRVEDLTAELSAAEPDGRRLGLDGLHPNERGHAAIAEALAPLVLDALAARRSGDAGEARLPARASNDASDRSGER